MKPEFSKSITSATLVAMSLSLPYANAGNLRVVTDNDDSTKGEAVGTIADEAYKLSLSDTDNVAADLTYLDALPNSHESEYARELEQGPCLDDPLPYRQSWLRRIDCSTNLSELTCDTEPFAGACNPGYFDFQQWYCDSDTSLSANERDGCSSGWRRCVAGCNPGEFNGEFFFCPLSAFIPAGSGCNGLWTECKSTVL